MLFVSDSCRAGNYGGNGVGNRRSGAAATETKAVVHGGDGNKGRGGGNKEASEPAIEK